MTKGIPAGPEPVLVTGAGGFIGSHVCRLLDEQNVPFVGVLGPHNSAPSGTHLGSFVRADLADPAAVDDLVRRVKPRRIVNLAAVGTTPGATTPVDQYVQLNVQLPLRLFESMGPDCVLVQAGSMSQYRSSPTPLDEDRAARDHSTLYAWSKNAADFGLETLSNSSGKHCVRARVFGVIGHGEAPHRLLPTIIAACDSASDVSLSDGEQVRDILHVNDVASALLVVSTETQLWGQAVNIGRGAGRSVRWIAEKAVSLLGCRSALRFGAQPRRPGEADCLVADIHKLDSIGWRPTWSLEDSIDLALRQMSGASSSIA